MARWQILLPDGSDELFVDAQTVRSDDPEFTSQAALAELERVGGELLNLISDEVQ